MVACVEQLGATLVGAAQGVCVVTTNLCRNAYIHMALTPQSVSKGKVREH